MVKMGLERLVVTLKSKIRCLKPKRGNNNNNYDKIEKSESMRVEIRSRKARKLIEETLKIADSPNHTKSFAFWYILYILFLIQFQYCFSYLPSANIFMYFLFSLFTALFSEFIFTSNTWFWITLSLYNKIIDKY